MRGVNTEAATASETATGGTVRIKNGGTDIALDATATITPSLPITGSGYKLTIEDASAYPKVQGALGEFWITFSANFKFYDDDETTVELTTGGAFASATVVP